MHAEARYSIKEAAALADLSERVIRNEIERGIIRVGRISRSRSAGLTLPEGAVFYFRLLKDVPVKLPCNERRDLFRLLASGGERAGVWRYERGTLRRGILALDAKSVRVEFLRRLRAYDAGRKKVASDPNTLGGEPVFAGTRISVRHVGKLVGRGVPASDIKADFPTLTDDDIAFAALFARMKPGPGRPSKLRFRREAA
ncbi:MAG: DUF433 domain-containing protein [Pseudomonadota bacterium]